MYQVILTFFIIITLIRGEDYYEILGINRSADQDEIRKAFKKLAIIYHPDKNNDDPNAHDKFVRLTTAYEVLKDNNLRKKYDLYGEDGLNNSNKKQTYHSWTSPYYYENSFMYEDDQYVINLEESDYFENIMNSDSSWFVNFYSPMCSHCHYLAPTWKEIAKLLNGIMKIAAVNCEYNRQLCHREGVRAYPTLICYGKRSQHGEHYTEEKSQEAIMRFALDRLNIHISEINKMQWELFLNHEIITQRPVLIFICDDQQNCFTSDERLIVAATFDKLIDVRLYICEDHYDMYREKVRAIYLPMYSTSYKPVFFNSTSDINTLIEKLWEQLPNPQELTDNDFDIIKRTEFNAAWLICFYIGDSENLKDLNLQMKKFSISGINLGIIHCGKNGQFCNKLGINRYPVWGMLKPGGAFELNHGKATNNDIIKFVQISIKTTNLWALSAEEALSILQNKENEVWFLDWYSPRCPPCIRFLSELRRASLKFDASIVRFGTIDCTVHTMICHHHNIQQYPTAMLLNGSKTYQFTLQKTAANIIQFINEKRNPSVIELTSENFNRKLAKKKSKIMWIVDYFASWCAPCQRLASEWIAVAKSLSSLSFVNVASVDCEAEASLCASQGIRSYPTIRMYPLGSEGLNTIALYNGQRDSLSILTWITKFLPKKIHDLNPSDFQRMLEFSKYIWIVDFYLPQCWHCQKMEPEFAIAAQLLEKVKFGRINCNFYMNECAHIKVFPTLILYKPKQKKKNRHDMDNISIVATTAEEIRDEILKIINFRIKHDEL
ncbi:dnaJ homolog subfamily C member 10 [Camponotus floridanus]|nr:dnaJ homolog subfamily C member 10 [Camponotus floridanus]